MIKDDHIGKAISEILCAISAVGLIIFSIYLIPFIFFDVHYNVPQFVVTFHYYLQQHHDLDGHLLRFAVFIPFVIAIFALFYIARRFEARTESEAETELKRNQTEAAYTQSEIVNAEKLQTAAQKAIAAAREETEAEMTSVMIKPDSGKEVLVFIVIFLGIIAVVEFLIYFDLS